MIAVWPLSYHGAPRWKAVLALDSSYWNRHVHGNLRSSVISERQRQKEAPWKRSRPTGKLLEPLSTFLIQESQDRNEVYKTKDRHPLFVSCKTTEANQVSSKLNAQNVTMTPKSWGKAPKRPQQRIYAILKNDETMAEMRIEKANQLSHDILAGYVNDAIFKTGRESRRVT